jgi:hypothetical protein
MNGAQMQQQKMTLDGATLAIAASVVDRSLELMLDGQSKSSLNAGFKGVQKFCVHGAMNLAFQEMFPEYGEKCGRVNVCGGYASSETGYGQAEAIATSVLVQVANERFGYDDKAWRSGAMGVAPLNDDPQRSADDVTGILEETSRRLWAMSLEYDVPRTVEVRSFSWADEPAEGAQQAVYA